MPEGYSRYARHLTSPLPIGAVDAFREMINIIAGQGDAREIYEHFKRYFSAAAGQGYVRSSDEGWASTDLSTDMEAASANTPLFLSAFYDAIEALRPSAMYDLPALEEINDLCRRTRVGFEIQPPNIVPKHVVVSQAVSNVFKAASGTLRAWKEFETQKAAETVHPELPDSFDVAITVAGPDREHARALAKRLEAAGVAVFYDEFFPGDLWGRNLSDTFDEIFRKKSRFCVMFISRAYAAREWTNHERQSALARALKERGKAYVLPVRVDDTELPGLPSTIGYLSLRELGIDAIARLLINKVRSARKQE